MLKSLNIKFGHLSNQQKLNIDLNNITIFVGPNNSGKSLILKEIEQYITTVNKENLLIFDDFEFDFPSIEDLNSFFSTFEHKNSGSTSPPGYKIFGRLNINKGIIETTQLHVESMKDMVNRKDNANRQSIIQNFIKYYLIRLDGSTRFELTKPKATSDLLSFPTSHLMALFIDDNARYRIRDLLFDAFGLYFVIDPTSMAQFKVRLSSRPPKDKNEEQSLSEDSRQFHHQAKDIEEFSDGVKAYTGLLTAVFSSNYKVMLIDEPEAFLHPPLARKLGKCLAELAPSRNGNLIVSTHSPDFIMGCIQSGKNVNIIRLTYNNQISTANLLDSDELLTMMRDPLLRSTGVLSSLFHESVIITESDADRSFYQEINERLLNENRNGVNSCLFLNAQNKQTISRIMRPLRELGIRTAAIVDIDVIKEGGQPWTNLLRSAMVPETLFDSLNILRSQVKGYFNESGKDMKKDGGLSILSGDRLAACQSLFYQLAQYGIFVVPNGELESWLKNLESSGHGPNWLMKIFDKMGSDPGGTGYLKPGNNDVWSFMEVISTYLKV